MKDEMVSVLKKHGYDAVNDKGVVVVRISDIKKISAIEKEVLRIFKEHGYHASYGFRYTGEHNEQDGTDISDIR